MQSRVPAALPLRQSAARWRTPDAIVLAIQLNNALCRSMLMRCRVTSHSRLHSPSAGSNPALAIQTVRSGNLSWACSVDRLGLQNSLSLRLHTMHPRGGGRDSSTAPGPLPGPASRRPVATSGRHDDLDGSQEQVTDGSRFIVLPQTSVESIARPTGSGGESVIKGTAGYDRRCEHALCYFDRSLKTPGEIWESHVTHACMRQNRRPVYDRV